MNVEKTGLEGLLVIDNPVFEDDRGSFTEAFNLKRFEEKTGVIRTWVQDNQSVSRLGVLRGIHFQNPRPQGKLVRCIGGAIFDVAVDLRRSSDTFLDWFGIELTATNNSQLWIPEGFGHGFYAMTDDAKLIYKTTDYYVPDADRSLRWDDPDLGIDWPLDGAPIVSARDEAAPLMRDAVLFD